MIKLCATRVGQKITPVGQNVHSSTSQSINTNNLKKLLLPTVLMLGSFTGCASQSFQYSPFKPSQPTIAPSVVHKPEKEEKPKEKAQVFEVKDPFGEPKSEDFKPKYQDLNELGLNTSQSNRGHIDKSRLNLQNNKSQYNQPKTEALPLPESVYSTPTQTNAQPLQRPVWSPIPEDDAQTYNNIQYVYADTFSQTQPLQRPVWSPFPEDGQQSTWQERTHSNGESQKTFIDKQKSSKKQIEVSKPAITTESLSNEKEYHELITLFNKQIDINIREYLSNLKLKDVIEKRDDKNENAENLSKTLQEITTKTQNLLNKYCENETTKKQILSSLHNYTTAVEELYLNNIPAFIRNGKIQKSSSSSPDLFVLDRDDVNTYEQKKKELLALRRTFVSRFKQMEKSLNTAKSENSNTPKTDSQEQALPKSSTPVR